MARVMVTEKRSEQEIKKLAKGSRSKKASSETNGDAADGQSTTDAKPDKESKKRKNSHANAAKKKRRRKEMNGEKAGKAVEEDGWKVDRSPEAVEAAKEYLEAWKKRNEPKDDEEEPWKFKKLKQTWIIRWMYDADVVPKSMFTTILEYLNGMQGLARQRVLNAANEIIDAGVPEKAEDEEKSDEDKRQATLARRKYKRALQVAELLA